jgi:hypothetical protein
VFVSDGVIIADNNGIMINRKGIQMLKLITGRGSPIGIVAHLGAVTVSQSLFHALLIFAYIFVWNH